jgi:hypothetical protein
MDQVVPQLEDALELDELMLDNIIFAGEMGIDQGMRAFRHSDSKSPPTYRRCHRAAGCGRRGRVVNRHLLPNVRSRIVNSIPREKISQMY